MPIGDPEVAAGAKRTPDVPPQLRLAIDAMKRVGQEDIVDLLGDKLRELAGIALDQHAWRNLRAFNFGAGKLEQTQVEVDALNQASDNAH